MLLSLATSAAHFGLAPDDRHLLGELRKRGADVRVDVWEDPLIDWATRSVCCIRSTWDYTYRRDAFVRWAQGVAEVTRLLNPVSAVEWSTHKAYLLGLHKAGVPTVPTTLVRRGSAFDLDGHVDDRGWAEIVIKPAIGASGQWAARFAHDQMSAGQAHLDRIGAVGDVLIQPLLPSVTTEGELSVVWIDGAITHAVRKRGAAGDFRVHDDHGGTVEREEISTEAEELVDAALKQAPAELGYARIDLVRGLDDRLAVMELELVEPELFFRFAPEATASMADMLLKAGAH